MNLLLCSYAGTSRALRCLPTLGGETGDDFCRTEEETEAELKRARQVSKRAVVFSREGEIEEVERPITSSVGGGASAEQMPGSTGQVPRGYGFLGGHGNLKTSSMAISCFPCESPCCSPENL